jgi:hypothetical protein
VPHGEVAVHAADGVVVPGAAAHDVVDEVPVAAQAVVLEDLAVGRLDLDRLVEDRPRAGASGAGGWKVKPMEWW